MLYIGENRLGQPETKFAVIDPRELVLLYDYAIEPQKKFAIRFYMVNPELYKVVVYDDKKMTMYDMIRDRNKFASKLVFTGTEAHYFGELPIVAYYLGDEIQGIIEPVIPLIDDYDVLVSDSMVEFDRYANSYLKLVKMSIGAEDQRNLKKKRIFEQLPDKDAVSFLTKDIPTAYIEFMTKLIRDQIHIQSHVPDLGSGSFADGISGVAVDRLMFDFENVVSNAEAEFDTGLYDRIRLITNMYGIMGRQSGTFDEIMISHKRNKQNNGVEYSQIALNLKNAGFSQYAIVDYMPDEIIPDTDAELEREKEEQDAAMPDVEAIPPVDEPEADLEQTQEEVRA
jgi:SPP1 family phage portal protein